MKLGILVILFSAFSRTKQCESFRYTKEVPPANSFQIISNVSAASVEFLYAMCTADCFSHTQCNAVDVCGTSCRLIRGWDSIYTEGNATNQCQRYQIECDQGQFYDRVSETCVSHDYCDFESDSESTCFLTEDTNDDGDWTRNQGATPTSSTGPSAAKFGGYYKYMNAASLESSNEVTLISTKTFAARSHCLTFYYHMFGNHTGTLSVLVSNGTSLQETNGTLTEETNGTLPGETNGTLPGETNGTLTGETNGTLTEETNGTLTGETNGTLTGETNGTSPVETNGSLSGEIKWTVSGENQDVWTKVVGIDLELDPHTQIFITARKDPSGAMGDIALDFVELWPYPC